MFTTSWMLWASQGSWAVGGLAECARSWYRLRPVSASAWHHFYTRILHDMKQLSILLRQYPV